MAERLRWYAKQVLPLVYTSTYTMDGRRVETRWRMWFGRCFNIRTRAPTP